MYAVSLLPSEYKNMRSSLKRNDKLMFIGLIAGLASIVVLVTTLAIASVYDIQLERAKEENARLLKQIEALEPVERLQAQASEMLTQINQAAGSSPIWEDLIARIGGATPPTVEISNISAEYNDGVGRMSVSGTATSFDDVSEFIVNLNNLEIFGDVRCNMSTISGVDGSTGFEIGISSFPVMPYELKLGGYDK